MNKKIINILCLTLMSFFVKAQKIDSLIEVLKTTNDHIEKTSTLYEIGLLQQNTDSALYYFKKALRVSKNAKNTFGIGKCSNIIGNKKFSLNELDSALHYWHSAETAFIASYEKRDEHTVDIQLANTLYNLALVNYYKGNFQKTIEYVHRSLNLRLKNNEQNAMLSCYNMLGIVQLAQDEYDLAEDHFTDALDIATDLQDTVQMASMYNNLGGIYLSIKKYKKALNYYQNSLSLSDPAASNTSTKMNIGNTLKFLGRYEEARTLLLEGVKEFAKTEDTRQKVISLNLLGDLYVETEEWAKLIDVSEKSLKYLETYPFTEQRKFAAYNLSIGQEKIGYTKAALVNYKLYNSLKDSLFSEQKAKEIDRLEAQFEFEQNKRKISELTEDNLKSEIQIANDRILRLVMIVIFGFVILILIIIFISYKKKQDKKRHELAMTKLEIEQRMLRSQMNPHFIFNALNSVQSFVSTNHTFEAEVFLSKFSLLIRNILENSTHEYIGLDEEIETLKLYLELEKLRFDDKFEFTIDNQILDPSVNVPPMLIQPFVENSILHGMKGKTSKGHINLRFTEVSDDMILCVVEDDGVGRNNNTKKNGHQSLATQLTNDRISYFNSRKSSNFELKLIDLKNEGGSPAGTKVELLIPLNN